MSLYGNILTSFKGSHSVPLFTNVNIFYLFHCPHPFFNLKVSWGLFIWTLAWSQVTSENQWFCNSLRFIRVPPKAPFVMRKLLPPIFLVQLDKPFRNIFFEYFLTTFSTPCNFRSPKIQGSPLRVKSWREKNGGMLI